MEKIRIKYHDNELTRLEKISIGDFIDLRSAEDVFIPLNEYKLISLGISMQLPDGYFAEVVPRSSTFKNYGIIMTNSVGIIDESYCGTNDIWRFPAFCAKAKTVNEDGVSGTKIYKDDRICQFRIVRKMPEIEFEEVDMLNNPDRKGIGSTGVK